jgi:transmembrane 9 superfamily member 1
MLALYFLISFPLTLVGAITAKNFVGPFTSPCRTKQVPRALPIIPWYKGEIAQFFIAGFLPFSAIYVELYYVMISLWGTIMYTPYPILALVFIVLILVTSCITIAMTYLQISQEDHYWWWRAILSGGSTSFFILAYSVFFYNVESSMEGFLQMAFYAGYTVLTCYAFFLMLSTVGFISSLLFLKQIYSVIRID